MSSLSSKHPVAVIFGEALVDAFADGDVPGGAPFNVARHLGALGFDPLFVTRIGEDARGAGLLAELQRFGLSLAGVQRDAAHASGLVSVDESAPGVHTFRILPDMAWDYIDAADATAVVQAIGAPVNLLYYGSLAQRSANSRAAAAALLLAAPQAGWCDLNWRAGHVLPQDALAMLHAAQAAKLNEQELQMVLHWCDLDTAGASVRPALGEQSPAIAALLAGGNLQQLVVTYGADGFAAFDRQGTCMASGGGLPLERMVDTVGAGDAFTAVTLAGTLAGWPLPLTLERANQFAAALCGERGAAPASLTFYAPWREAWSLA